MCGKKEKEKQCNKLNPKTLDDEFHRFYSDCNFFSTASLLFKNTLGVFLELMSTKTTI